MRRRLHKRMLAVGSSDIEQYLAYIRQHPDELDALFETLLINVTEFFRDPGAWATFEREVLPGLIEKVNAGETLRVWCVGCASGEEPYSIAILFAEKLKSNLDLQRVKIFATDIDDAALTQARAGRYDAARVVNVSPERLERFFTETSFGYEISKSIRRMVVFGRHDLTRDPPIGRLDVLVCRNVLIYFDLPLQRRVLSAFHYGLSPGGVLFLGRSEDIPRDERFEAIDRSARLFTSRGGARRAMPMTRGTESTPDQKAIDAAVQEAGVAEAYLSPLVRFLLDGPDIAFCVMDEKLTIRLANDSAVRILAPDATNMQGRSLLDVLQQAGVADVHAVEAFARSRAAPVKTTLRLVAGGQRRFVDISLAPYDDERGHGTIVIAHDVTEREETRTSMREQARELQETIEELQTTNEELQSANEELMTSNEELQSSNEELATVNEEFQSTNEELETTNEELQSTNAELEALNAEMHRHNNELDALRRAVDAYGAVGTDAIIRCDADLRIVEWSDRAQDVFGHRARDVLEWNLHAVDFRVDGSLLRDLIERAKESPSAVESAPVEFAAGHGRSGRGVFVAQALREEGGELTDYLVLYKDRTSLISLEMEVKAAKARFDALVDVIERGVLVLDANGKVLQMTDKARDILQEAKVAEAEHVWELATDKAQRLQIRGAMLEIGRDGSSHHSTDLRVDTEDGRGLWLKIVGASADVPPLILLSRGPAAAK